MGDTLPDESPQKSHPVATGFLLLYALFLCACAFLTLADPPWKTSGGVSGALGFLASMAAGLPWSVAVLLAMLNCNVCNFSTGVADVLMVILIWAGAFFNLGLLVRAAGWTKAAPEPARTQPLPTPLPVVEPVAKLPVPAALHGPRIPLRVTLARWPASVSRSFDAVRERRAVTVAAVVLTFLLGLPAFMGLLASANARTADTAAFWSIGVFAALAGSWSRVLSSNRELQDSHLRFGVALAGTACGTALATRSAAGWAPYAPGWTLFALLLAGWQGWLLLATIGSLQKRTPTC
jgi:hypothetical protein